jgi:hypothetical protein
MPDSSTRAEKFQEPLRISVGDLKFDTHATTGTEREAKEENEKKHKHTIRPANFRYPVKIKSAAPQGLKIAAMYSQTVHQPLKNTPKQSKTK